MIHKLAMGHFDVEALKDRKLNVLRPLDMNAVKRLLQKIGQVADDGRASLARHPVEFKDGHIICPWLMAQRVSATEELASRDNSSELCARYPNLQPHLAVKL